VTRCAGTRRWPPTTPLKRALAGEGLAAYTAGKRELVAGALARSAIALPPPRPAGYDGPALAAALVAQWQLLALHAPTLELAAPTRVTGWRNSEVLATSRSSRACSCASSPPLTPAR